MQAISVAFNISQVHSYNIWKVVRGEGLARTQSTPAFLD